MFEDIEKQFFSERSNKYSGKIELLSWVTHGTLSPWFAHNRKTNDRYETIP